MKEVLVSSNKDITWICLYSARLLSVLIREFTQLTAAMLPIVFQVRIYAVLMCFSSLSSKDVQFTNTLQMF